MKYLITLLVIIITVLVLDFFLQDVEEERLTLDILINDTSMGSVEIDTQQRDYGYGDEVIITAVSNDGYYTIWNSVNEQWDDNLLNGYSEKLAFSENFLNNQIDIYVENQGSNYLIKVSNKHNEWEILYQGALGYQPDLTRTGFFMAIGSANYHFNLIGSA